MDAFLSSSVLASNTELLIAIVTGFLVHWLWFVRGEHDNHAGIYVHTYASLSFVLVLLRTRWLELSVEDSVASSALIVSAHLVALYASIITFRLFFSPVRHIPGPTRLKVSKLPHFWAMRRQRNWEFLSELHEQYGDIVRTGPNEVTMFNPEAFLKVYGPESRCTKSIFYDAPRPFTSVVNQRDTQTHARWRKVWDQAFNQKALDSYEPLVYGFAEDLISMLRTRVNQPIDISEYFEFYTFDILGRLGIDVEFGLLQGNECRPRELYHAGAKVLGPIISIPWFIHATSLLKPLRRGYHEQNAWIRGELLKKREVKPEKNTVIDHVIIDSFANGGFDANANRLQGDWLITMLAGIDPMTKALTYMLYHAARNKEHARKIREELSTLDDITNYRELQQLPYFEGFLKETLRLNPAIPAGGPRVVPPDGLNVGGTFIPGGTITIVPHHVLFRREDCYVRPTEFIPERWTTQPELVLDKRSFQPWSMGRFSCIGKNLGLMEIRVAAALVIDRFDCEFAAGEDGTDLFDKTTDHFTSIPGPLKLVLKERKAS